MRAADASKQTAELIEESGKHAQDGVSFTGEVVQALDDIEKRSEQVSAVMGEISAASEQQQTGVSQVNTAIEQMNLVTQQVAANSEESASAAEELASQAAHMQAMLGQFEISGTRKSSAAVHTPTFTAGPKAVKRVAAASKAPVKAARPSRVSAAEIIPFDEPAEDDSALLHF